MIEGPHEEWLERRGIPSTLAGSLGITTVTREGAKWLAIPYRQDGAIVNRKYRRTGQKDHRMDKGGKLCFWNGDVISGVGEIIITEGEFDAMAVMAAGFERVVSVPNGAPARANDNPLSADHYAYIWDYEDALKKIERFVLATDGDKPGRALARDLAAILGPERCRFIEYPEGCKDLNDILQRHGDKAVVKAIVEAKPYPVRGLYTLDDFPDATPVEAVPTGLACLDEHMALVLGTFTVFSGYSNMGKSTVLNGIIASCIARDIPVCVASFETMPKPILRDGIARALIGCSFEAFPRHPDRRAAYEQIGRRLTIISNAYDDDTDIDVETYLDLARAAVIRHGAKLIVLDPWNELEHKRRRDETETDYIGRAIRALKRFAKRYNVALWVVAHPTKPQGKIGPPGLYDIAGSANWANKADYGLIYHRPDKTINAGTLSVVKVRMGLPGKCGVIEVKMDDATSRLVPAETFA
jgi:twinkle protein